MRFTSIDISSKKQSIMDFFMDISRCRIRKKKQNKTKQNKTKHLNMATMANKFCWTNLVNTDLNTWIAGLHIYKTIFF